MNKIDFLTSDFFIGNKYSKIISVKTNLYGNTKYNDIQVIFGLIHFTSNKMPVLYKKYALSVKCEKNANDEKINIINFKDLTPDVLGIECVGVLNKDDILDVYVKGSLDGAKIKGTVLYIHDPGYFTFYQDGQFNNDLTGKDLIIPNVNDGDFRRYSGLSRNFFNFSYRGDSPYNCIGKIVPDNINNFAFTAQISLMECVSDTSAGRSYLYHLMVKPDEAKQSRVSLNYVGAKKELKLIVLKNADKDEYLIYLYTPNKYAYGRVCMNVLMYDTANTCKFYQSEDFSSQLLQIDLLQNENKNAANEDATAEKEDTANEDSTEEKENVAYEDMTVSVEDKVIHVKQESYNNIQEEYFAGDIRFNPDTKKHEGFDGDKWNDLY